MRVKITLACTIGLHRVQTAKLQHNEEQEEQSRQTSDEQVLPLL